jgi:hypothetical protein
LVKINYKSSSASNICLATIIMYDIESACSKDLTAVSHFSRTTFGSSLQLGFSSFVTGTAFLKEPFGSPALYFEVQPAISGRMSKIRWEPSPKLNNSQSFRARQSAAYEYLTSLIPPCTL